MLTSTLILPGEDEPRTLGWEIKEELDHQVDIVVDAGDTSAEPTTVVDWSEGYPEIVRVGAGDPRASRPEPQTSVPDARVTRGPARQAQHVARRPARRCGGRAR